MQVPLSKWLDNSWATYGMTSQKSGPLVHQAGLSGTALTHKNFSYSLQQSYDRDKKDAGGSLSGTYRGAYGTVNTGYNYSRDNSQVNFGIQGAVVAHENGITFSQPLGDPDESSRSTWCEHSEQCRRVDRLAGVRGRALRQRLSEKPGCY